MKGRNRETRTTLDFLDDLGTVTSLHFYSKFVDEISSPKINVHRIFKGFPYYMLILAIFIFNFSISGCANYGRGKICESVSEK
jgi:hypothetical protein